MGVISVRVLRDENQSSCQVLEVMVCKGHMPQDSWPVQWHLTGHCYCLSQDFRSTVLSFILV